MHQLLGFAKYSMGMLAGTASSIPQVDSGSSMYRTRVTLDRCVFGLILFGLLAS